MRLAIVPVRFSELTEKTKTALLAKIFELVPSGVGKGHKGKTLQEQDYKKLLIQGAKWSIEQGFGFAQDLEHMESNGKIEGADMHAISSSAILRGRDQLGSIGSGNHFVEIGEVQKIFLPEIAAAWDVQEGQTYVLIHSGSRGFGHQVCQDTLDAFIAKGFAEGLPDRQLVAAPLQSQKGTKQYFAAMAAAANYAFNKQAETLYCVRTAFQEVLHIFPEKIRLVYDVCHNIAKFEVHGGKKLCVHRKGATRARAGAEELAPIFRKTGQPVLVPGDMGRASYLLVGLGNPLTFCSCCHGAGRAQSRVQSMKSWKDKDIKKHMEAQGAQVTAPPYRTIAEEMPDAYKDVDSVVEAVSEAKLANKVARLRPHLVVKG